MVIESGPRMRSKKFGVFVAMCMTIPILYTIYEFHYTAPHQFFIEKQRKEYTYLNEQLIVTPELTPQAKLAELRRPFKFPKNSALTKPGNMTYWNTHCLRFECNKNETACDTTEPTNYDGPDPPCCTHLLRDLVLNVSLTFTDYGVEHFLSYGTLLGAVRNGRIIPWTADADMGVVQKGFLIIEKAKFVLHSYGYNWINDGIFNSSFNSECIEDFQRYGEYASTRSGLMWRTPEARGMYYDTYPYMDLYALNTAKNMDLIQIAHIPCSYKPEWIFPLKTIPFYGVPLPVPANPHELLAEKYGDDYMTPRREGMGNGIHGFPRPQCRTTYNETIKWNRFFPTT